MGTVVLCNGMIWRRRARLALVIGVAGAAVNTSIADGLTARPLLQTNPAAGVQNLTPPAPRPAAEIRLSQLTPDATLAVELQPGSTASDDAIWIPQRSGRSIVRLDVKKNAVDAPVNLGHAPCASLAVAFDSVWVPTCEAGAIARVDAKNGNISASVPLPVTTPEGPIAVAVGSVWVATDAKGVVSRIDPATNQAVAEAYVAAEPNGVAAQDDAVWVTSAAGHLLTRIDAHTNVVVETIEVGPRPGRIAIGEGAVWTLNRGDGSVTRVDLKTNKAVTTVAVGGAVADGDIAVGEGSVWLSAPGVPIIRIDPRNNRVAQRFVGEGGGAIVVAHGSIWLAVGPKSTWRLDPKLVAAMRP
jgi:streptogramin lyase